MAARRRTSRRKKTTRRRSPKPMLNVANAAQTVVVANAATTAFFGTRLDNFLLDGWARPAQGNFAAGSYAGGSNNSWELSMAEIVKGLIPGGQGAGITSPARPTILSNIKYNLQNNPEALATMVFAPIAFTVGKKLLSKPLINPLNKGIRSLGLGSIVKV